MTDQAETPDSIPRILSVSAVTLATHDMGAAVRFYRALGFEIRYGGEESAFTSFHCGSQFLNLTAQPKDRPWSGWGRIVFYVEDVDLFYAHAKDQGLATETVPRDAPWHERYFHMTDPDGHELSFAKPIA